VRTISGRVIPKLVVAISSAAKNLGSSHGATCRSDTPASVGAMHCRSTGAVRMGRLSLLRAFAMLLVFFLPCTARLAAQTAAGVPIYLDPKQPIERRVDDLMRRMTLKEKVGQLNLPCVYVDELGKTIPEKMEACRRFAAGTYTSEIGPGCGFFTLADTILHKGVRQQVDYFNELQKIALTQTRLKIPLLEDEEGTHGAMFPGATVFPEGLAIGSTFDMPLVKAIYAAAAQEARSVGIHVLSTLVLELDRDPRMGRNEEAYTEDPYLYSRIAENVVRGGAGFEH
jgi:beta-glucosidase